MMNATASKILGDFLSALPKKTKTQNTTKPAAIQTITRQPASATASKILEEALAKLPVPKGARTVLYQAKDALVMLRTNPFYVLAVDTRNNAAIRQQILKKAKAAGLKIDRIIVPKMPDNVLQKDGSFRRQNVQTCPGYLIVQCRLTDDLMHFFDGLTKTGVSTAYSYRARADNVQYDSREYVHDVDADAEFETRIASKSLGVFGFLSPRPTFTKKIPGRGGRVMPRPPKELRPAMGVVVDKDTGGKMFYVRRDKETGEVIMTEHDEIKQVRNWKPVPIETYEAAIILIRGTGTKKTKENPYDAAKVGPAVGEKVRIKEGIYQFLEGAVTKIDGTNYTVETVLMGRQVKVQANKLQLEIVK